MLGREGQTEEFKGMYGLVGSCRMQNTRGPWLQTFYKAGGDEFGCCYTPCPCCHVSMEMRAGQDIALDYLGVRQGKHLVSTPPFAPAPQIDTHCPRPTLGSLCCLPHSLPLSGSYANWTQAGLLVSALHSQVSLAADSVHLAQRQP